MPDYTSALNGNIRSMRVGVITEQVNSKLVEPEVRQAVVNATSVLGELGASVDEVSLPLARHARLITSLPLLVEPALNHRDWIRDRLQDYGHGHRISHLTGSIMPALAYYKAQKLRSMLRHQVIEVLQRYDVLVLPILGRTAQRIEDFDQVITSKQTGLRIPFLLTGIFNLASTPAVSVPCGFSSQGLPIGLQIGGRPDEDATVLKVAHAYEQHTPWHTRRPTAVQEER